MLGLFVKLRRGLPEERRTADERYRGFLDLAIKSARFQYHPLQRRIHARSRSQFLILREHLDKALHLGALLDLEIDRLSSTDRALRVLFVLERKGVDRVVAHVLQRRPGFSVAFNPRTAGKDAPWCNCRDSVPTSWPS